MQAAIGCEVIDVRGVFVADVEMAIGGELQRFGVQRDLVRALCLDSGEELRAAWKRIQAQGGAERQPEAMEWLLRLPQSPVPVTWTSAVATYASASADRLDYMRRWTAEMRANYRQARARVRTTGP